MRRSNREAQKTDVRSDKKKIQRSEKIKINLFFWCKYWKQNCKVKFFKEHLKKFKNLPPRKLRTLKLQFLSQILNLRTDYVIHAESIFSSIVLYLILVFTLSLQGPMHLFVSNRLVCLQSRSSGFTTNTLIFVKNLKGCILSLFSMKINQAENMRLHPLE